MLLLAGLIVAAFAKTTTTDDDTYCGFTLPWWYGQFYTEAASDSVLSALTVPTDLATTDPTAFAAGMGGPHGVSHWDVATAEHTAQFVVDQTLLGGTVSKPMQHCEVMHYCLRWAGYGWDYSAAEPGSTIGNHQFYNPLSAKSLACAFYYCAENFFHVDEAGLHYFELQLKYVFTSSGNFNELNADLNVDRTCACNAQLAAAYPTPNNKESVFTSASAATCRADVVTGGTRDGGWLWYCENLNCVNKDTKFRDYYTCTMKTYHGVNWEDCPTLDQWLTMNYGIGFGGAFMNHLLTIFILIFLAFIPFIMIYSACCSGRGSNQIENGV